MTENSILENIISALEQGDNKRALDIAKKRLEYANAGLLVLDSSHKRTAQDSVKTLLISATASATGAAFVYPIDLVKTRMQNQRNVIIKDGILYKNSLDCLKKVIQTEGVFSLYRGLGVNLMGQVPEKTIRLFVIDRIRHVCAQYLGNSHYQESKSVKYLTEATAGSCVGALQVIITNPAEIIKVRLQLASDSTMPSIFRDIGGFKGMYKGASACFLRDIPFSGIYFPTYAICKDMLNIQNSNDVMGFFNILLSGSIAGMAADVIKTRLQAKNSTEYRGLFDCLQKIISTEGYKSLFKGLLPRVIRSSPQYGCMLLSYEVLLKLFKKEEITPQLFDQQISYSRNNIRDKYFSLHKWTPPPHFYTSLPNFKTVSIGGSGTIWAISEDNKPYLWNGVSWHLVPNTSLNTISCGADGTACGIDDINNTIQIWSPWHMKFFATSNKYNLSKVSVGNADKIWALDNKGQVYCYEKDNAWTRKGTTIMKHISVGSDGTAVDIYGCPFKWADSSWHQIACDKQLSKVSVGAASSIWGVDTENNLYRFLDNRWIAQDYKATHISAAHDGLIERMKNTV